MDLLKVSMLEVVSNHSSLKVCLLVGVSNHCFWKVCMLLGSIIMASSRSVC